MNKVHVIGSNDYMIEMLEEHISLAIPSVDLKIDDNIQKTDIVVCVNLDILDNLMMYPQHTKKVLWTGAKMIGDEFVLSKIKLKDLKDVLILDKSKVTMTEIIQIIKKGLR